MQRKKEEKGDPFHVELHSRMAGLIVPDISLAQKFKEILGWLDGLNCVEKQDVTLLLRQPDTCKWLFNTAQYMMWRGGQSPCLWLCGKRRASAVLLTHKSFFTEIITVVAGAGKTVLAYVNACYTPMVLNLLVGPLSLTPLRRSDNGREKSLLFSIVIFETSVLRVLQKHCGLYSPSYYINFARLMLTPEA